MPTRKLPDNQLPPTDFPPLMKEIAAITFWTGVARFCSVPASWIPFPPLRWARQTLEQGDELLLISAITLIGAMVIWVSFSGYLTQARQTPWQTWCTALSYLAPFAPGTSWLIQKGGDAMVWILTNLNYMAHQRSKAEGRVSGRAEGEAEGEAIGEARGRAEGEAIGETRGRAEGEAIGEARGRAEGIARGRAAERAELLDQMVQEGLLTPEQRAEKEAQRRADDAAQNSNHDRE